MRTLSFTVPPEYDGARGSAFLRGCCGLSYHTVLALKQVPDGVTADGMLLRTIDRVRAGQRVVVTLPPETKPPQVAVNFPFEVPVLYEDDDVLVFDKPAGMPVHPSAGHSDDTLANYAAAYQARSGEGPAPFRPVCRLDRDTTGILVTAKHAHAAFALAGRVDKSYLAVAQGLLEGAGVVDAPLRRKEGHGIVREVAPDGIGERAVTRWRVISQGAGHTVLRFDLETGRTHQIRAHCAYLGHPLAGDELYGGARGLIGRQALHCGRASFPQPITGEPVVLNSPLPADMRALLAAIGADEMDLSGKNTGWTR